MKNRMNIILYNTCIIIAGLSFICRFASSQVSFVIPDTICIYDSVIIINNSRTASTYYWNFCTGNIINTPQGENLQNQGNLNGPSFIDIVKDGELYYAFITNTDGTLTRYFFNNDLLSIPVSDNLGNFESLIPLNAQGIQVIKDGGVWYVLITGGQGVNSRIVRLNFGNSLNNEPTFLNLGNIGNLDSPMDLFMFEENNNWYGYTVNFNSSTITRFNFGNSLNNRPHGLNLGNIGNLDGPGGFIPWRENNNWYIFIANLNSNQITRLDFGSSFFNIPAGENIGGEEFLYQPFDLVMSKDCDIIFGYVFNSYNEVVRLDFNDGILNKPVFTLLGEMDNLYNPHGLSNVFRINDSLYAFVANVDNSTLTRLLLTGCSNSSISSSTDRDPPIIYYDSPGIYQISLVLDEGTINQEYYCQNIAVFESPDFSLGNDTTIAMGTVLLIDAGEGYSEYHWSTGETSQIIEVNTAGIYSVTVSNQYGCPAVDEIEVIVDFGISNFITPNGDGYNDIWEIPFLRNNIDADVKIYDRFGKLITSYKGSEQGWDGTANGKLVNPDTYWYIIDLNDDSDPIKGKITVNY
jgi:gliding motility-associated-like protein